MSGGEERFFFVHLQKTAGVSFRARLQHHFGEAGVYPDESDEWGTLKSVASVDHLQRRYRARRDEIRVVTGHFPLAVADMLPDEFTTLTILREPVERTLSYLRHHRALTLEAQAQSLDEIYAEPFRFHNLVHNHMVKMLSLTDADPAVELLSRVEFTPDRLEFAKQRLAAIDAFGFQERFEEFCDQLERRFGWDLGPPQQMNATGHAEVSDELRTRIAEDNAMDVELYEFALRLYEERRSADSAARVRS